MPQDITPPMNPPRVIKRYSNRKLYDTEQSRYITLLELGALLQEGVTIEVHDNNTKEDLTEITLAQVLIAQTKQGQRGFKKFQSQAEELLHKISNPVQNMIATPVQHIRDEAIKQVERLAKISDSPKATEDSGPKLSAAEKLLSILYSHRIETLERKVADLTHRLEALERKDDGSY